MIAPVINVNDSLKSLEVQAYLIQQEDTNEQMKLARSLERYIREKKVSAMRQTNIDQYFNQQ